MPGPSTVCYGNIRGSWILATTLSPVSVGVTTSTEQTFTVTGLNLGDFIDVSKPTTQPGLALGNCRVSASNTLAINFVNITAATITPTASEVYTLVVTRPENLNPSNNSILSQLV
jgi:hypothetical protein